MKRALFILTALLLGSTMTLMAQDERPDRDEYDLYDRNRDDADFNRYDYPPEHVANCPYCQQRQSSQQQQQYYYPYQNRR